LSDLIYSSTNLGYEMTSLFYGVKLGW